MFGVVALMSSESQKISKTKERKARVENFSFMCFTFHVPTQITISFTT